MYWVLVIGIFALALGVRLYGIGKAPLWDDEIFSWVMAHYTPAQIFVRLYEGNNPPLWEILLHFWRLLVGDEVGALRGLAALASSLGAVGLFVLGSYTGGRAAGLIATFLWIFSDFGQSVGRELRAYALLAALTPFAYYFFLRWLAERKYFIPWTLTLLALYYTHYMGLTVTVAQIGMLLILGRPYRRGLGRLLLLLSVGVGLTGVVFVERLVLYPTTSFAPKSDWEGLYNALWRFSNQPVPTVMALLLIGTGLLAKHQSGRTSLADFTAYLGFLGIFIGIWLIGHFVRIWEPRYLMPAAMAYYWVIALSIMALPSWGRFIAAFALLLAWSLSWNPLPPGQAPFQSILFRKISAKPDHQPLLISPRWYVLDAAYYLDRSWQHSGLLPLEAIFHELYHRYRIIGATYYADLPVCFIERTDTLWWLEYGYNKLLPKGQLQRILAEDFRLLHVERIWGEIRLWGWVRRQKPAP
ncbi:MAG: glycosyltransferase family 39 protein [Bacteroidia bacterium]|nr:glycosyltransferase family 39 protein [Bacteroidia bacterium]MDW8088828.1 glycosyltransferase family 39 protein [Bacteroidia bacterium]